MDDDLPDGAERPVDPRAAAQKAVLAVHQGFYDAIERGDIELMESLWATEGDLVCVHPGAEPVRGRQQVLRSWSFVMASTGYIQFILTDVGIAMPCDDVAIVTCTENVLAEADGQPADTFAGAKSAATTVLVRRAGRWGITTRHASPVLITDDEAVE